MKGAMIYASHQPGESRRYRPVQAGGIRAGTEFRIWGKPAHDLPLGKTLSASQPQRKRTPYRQRIRYAYASCHKVGEYHLHTENSQLHRPCTTDGEAVRVRTALWPI